MAPRFATTLIKVNFRTFFRRCATPPDDRRHAASGSGVPLPPWLFDRVTMAGIRSAIKYK
jgi:hypothetical protein